MGQSCLSGKNLWVVSPPAGNSLSQILDFDSILASKFVNCLMWDGKKSVALRIFL